MIFIIKQYFVKVSTRHYKYIGYTKSKRKLNMKVYKELKKKFIINLITFNLFLMDFIKFAIFKQQVLKFLQLNEQMMLKMKENITYIT